MKHFILLLIASLLVACAGQKQPPETTTANDIPTDHSTQNNDVIANDVIAAEEAIPEAGQIMVTGSRIRTQKLMEHEAYGLPMPTTLPVLADRENYQHFDNHSVQSVLHNPVSTFSIDVDTGAYANVRRFLNQGQLPRQDAVRIEELINYFAYDYAAPEDQQTPFLTHTALAPSPWNAHAHLLHIGIKGYEVPREERPDANLVFLLDVSGSMNSPDKLGLLKKSMKLLSKQLTAKDSVSIVVYAGAAGVVLQPTAGNDQAKIATALDQLRAGGSTNGAAGIHLAYQLAEQQFIDDGINRILIATDGDFNVGTTDFNALLELVEKKRETGISLTHLGFGTGNYNDHLMEQLADTGNGNHAYIDTIKEANKVLVEQINATFMTIAKDVKIQIEFNPAVVSEYRLIGYENRQLNDEDFANDQVDAGEIGAGHTVTAIYELVLQGNPGWLPESRYQQSVPVTEHSDEVAFIKIRYKQPDEDHSQLLKWAVMKSDQVALDELSNDVRFATAVAAFGQLLRKGTYLKSFCYDDVLTLARNTKGDDPFGYRGEFVQLVSLAKSLAD